MSDAATMREMDTRSLIVATAERLFRTLGYQKTTMGDVAKELDMSPANVYRFFSSKAELRDAVGRLLMEQVEAAVGKIAASADEPPSARLKQAFLVMNQMNEARYISDHKMHEMIAVALDEAWDMVVAHIAVIDTHIARICAEGIATGEFREMDPLAAARFVKTAMIRFCHPLLLEQCAEIPGPTASEMMDYCLQGLRKI